MPAQQSIGKFFKVTRDEENVKHQNQEADQFSRDHFQVSCCVIMIFVMAVSIIYI